MREDAQVRALLEGLASNSLVGQGNDSQRSLVKWAVPIVRARVVRIWGRQLTLRRCNLTQHDIDEVTQDVLSLLFVNRARVILSWDRDRGVSLANYVGLVAERAATRCFQIRSRQAFATRTECTSVVAEELADCCPGPEALLSEHEYVEMVVGRIRSELSDRGNRLFEMLLLEERPVDEVSNLTGLSRDATYTWRSRIARLARRIAREVEIEYVTGG